MEDAPPPAPTPVKVRKVIPKQEKPFPDFPLAWHHRGYWYVKRGGKQVGYGPDWKKAYDDFRADEGARLKGESAPSRAPKVYFTLRDARNAFLERQTERLEAGEIGSRQFAKLRGELDRTAKVVGWSTSLADFAGEGGPDLFRDIKRAAIARGLAAAEQQIIATTACLNFANRRRMMSPPNYGDEFDKPGATQVRKGRAKEVAKHGARAFTIAELRTIIAAAKARSPALYAQVLLGLNCAFGAADCSELPQIAIDRKGKLIRFARVKTGIDRVCPLWPVTAKALDAAIAARPEPVDPKHAGRVFLTENGIPPVRVKDHKGTDGTPQKITRIDTINLTFKRLLVRAGIKRKGSGFYTLRSAWRVLALNAGADPVTVSLIMGHGHAGVDAAYVRGDVTARLIEVTEHIRRQLWPR